MRILASFAWFLLGSAFFGCLYLLPSSLRNFYSLKEPFFSAPIAAPGKVLRIRNDRHGKGTFGASRSGRRVHQGIDLLSPVGNSVFASKSGRVIFSGEGKGYGNYVEILHPDGLTSLYAHLSTLSIKEGDWVERNSALGNSGHTGNAHNRRITPHLHFEIRYREQALNPGSHLLDPSLRLVNP